MTSFQEQIAKDIAALQESVDATRAEREQREQHHREVRESLADPNRKAQVYGLSDGQIRYIGVSFYPEHQKQVLSEKGGELGTWILKTSPQIVLFEKVSKKDSSKRVNWWRRRFKERLIKSVQEAPEKALEEMDLEELKAKLRREIRRLND